MGAPGTETVTRRSGLCHRFLRKVPCPAGTQVKDTGCSVVASIRKNKTVVDGAGETLIDGALHHTARQGSQ